MYTSNIYFYIFSRPTVNDTFTAKYDGVLPKTPWMRQYVSSPPHPPHSDDLSQIRVVLLIGIGRATREMCFNQSEALPWPEQWHAISMEFLPSFLRHHFPTKRWWLRLVASQVNHWRNDSPTLMYRALYGEPMLLLVLVMMIKLQ